MKRIVATAHALGLNGPGVAIKLDTKTGQTWVLAPTAKQHLAAIRHLFDRLVMGQVVPLNPAASVRGPSHSVRRGKTPALDPLEAL